MNTDTIQDSEPVGPNTQAPLLEDPSNQHSPDAATFDHQQSASASLPGLKQAEQTTVSFEDIIMR